jgi:hypothetical protein
MNEKQYNRMTEDEAVEYERRHINVQLKRRDDPYSMVESFEIYFPEMPDPIMEGQTLNWTERTHFCGRVLATFELRAVYVPCWDGLYWISTIGLR